MIDHRILQQIGVNDNSPVLNMFQNALTGAQNRKVQMLQDDRAQELAPFQHALLKAQAQNQIAQANAADEGSKASGSQNQLNMENSRTSQRLSSIHTAGQRIKPMLLSGNTVAAEQFLKNRISQIQSRIEQGSGEDVNESMEALAKLQAGDVQGLLGDISAVEGLVLGGGRQKQFALQSNAPITDPVTGQVSTPVFNPATGETQLVPIEGATQETPTQEAAREFQAAKNIADLDVSTTERKEIIRKRVARNSALKTEFSTKRKLAATSFRKIKEAQKLMENATQGLAGVGKVQLGRLFPGIDTSNEAALTGAFKSLALDELQKFKGPTTDFEFRVTEDIAGSLGDGASANKARLASLERASWFASREAKQFSDHQKGGHDPDEFFFNFNELVTPKKGGKSYSLQSLQDTAVANHISVDEVIKRLSK